MKILFYTYTLDKDSGGALHSNMILVDGFKKKGHEVFLVVHKLGENDIETDCPVFTLDTNLGDLGRPFALKKVIKTLQPDAVIANMKPQNINLSLAKLFLGKSKTRFIGVERNPDLQFRYGEGKVLFRKIMKKLYENLDIVVGNSIATKEDLKKSFFVEDKKIEVIYNTVDFSKVQNLAQEEILEKEEEIFRKKVLINVGRLTNQKGQELLLRSFSKLEQSKYNLVIVGSGDRLEFLIDLSKELGIERNIFFLGHQNNPFKYVKKADLFVLTSHYEGFGRVVLESMVLKTPVIGFNSIGGHNELLEDGNGVLVEYKDVDKLALEIDSLIDSPQRREEIIQKNQEFIKEFHIEKHLNLFLDLVKSSNE